MAMRFEFNANEVFWLLVRFFTLMLEVSVIVFGFLFGHILNSRRSVKLTLALTFGVSLLLTAIQGVLDFLGHARTTTGSNVNYSKLHGIFLCLTSVVFTLAYLLIILIPFTRLKRRFPKVKRSFYGYAIFLFVTNFIQALGCVLIFVNQFGGLCLVDISMYIYLGFFSVLVYFVILRDFFKMNLSDMIFYDDTKEYSEGAIASTTQTVSHASGDLLVANGAARPLLNPAEQSGVYPRASVGYYGNPLANQVHNNFATLTRRDSEEDYENELGVGPNGERERTFRAFSSGSETKALLINHQYYDGTSSAMPAHATAEADEYRRLRGDSISSFNARHTADPYVLDDDVAAAQLAAAATSYTHYRPVRGVDASSLYGSQHSKYHSSHLDSMADTPLPTSTSTASANIESSTSTAIPHHHMMPSSLDAYMRATASTADSTPIMSPVKGTPRRSPSPDHFV